jgi:hypothetical protein
MVKLQLWKENTIVQTGTLPAALFLMAAAAKTFPRGISFPGRLGLPFVVVVLLAFSMS